MISHRDRRLVPSGAADAHVDWFSSPILHGIRQEVLENLLEADAVPGPRNRRVDVTSQIALGTSCAVDRPFDHVSRDLGQVTLLRRGHQLMTKQAKLLRHLFNLALI